MAAIPTILKGDDSGAIALTLATGRTYTGATLVVAYQGITRTFKNLTPGGTVTISFTHEETGSFQLGCKPILMRLIGSSGAVETVENAEMMIKVTDCLGEVNAGGSFVVQPGGSSVDPTKVPITDVGDMSARYSLADLKAKVDQIVRVLAQRSLLTLLLSACCLSSSGAVSTNTARLDELYNDSLVVTNVTFVCDITPQDATNAAIVVVKPVSNTAHSAYTVAANALPRAEANENFLRVYTNNNIAIGSKIVKDPITFCYFNELSTTPTPMLTVDTIGGTVDAKSGWNGIYVGNRIIGDHTVIKSNQVVATEIYSRDKLAISGGGTPTSNLEFIRGQAGDFNRIIHGEKVSLFRDAIITSYFPNVSGKLAYSGEWTNGVGWTSFTPSAGGMKAVSVTNDTGLVGEPIYLASTNALTHYLSSHGGTATRADGETKGVEYTIQGGAEVRVGMSEEYLRGAKLSIGGGGGSYGDGGNGAEIVLGGGGSGDGSGGSGAKITLGSGNDGFVAGEGAQIVIGGHGSSTNEEDPTTYNGTLTITHTGNASETLTERIVRDASSLTNGFVTADGSKTAVRNDTQLWQDCVSPIADSSALYNRTEAYVYAASSNAVQYLTLGGGTNLVITPPASVSGKVMDWVVYANAEGGNAVILPRSAHWYATEESVTNALEAGVTAFYCTQMSADRFAVGRQKLANIVTKE